MDQTTNYRFLQNIGDFFPPGFLGENFIKEVTETIAPAEASLPELGQPLRELRLRYEQMKDFLMNTARTRPDANLRMHKFHTLLLQALGYEASGAYSEQCILPTMTKGREHVIPVRHILRVGNEPRLYIMEMQAMVQSRHIEGDPGGLFDQRYSDEEVTGSQAQIYRTSQWSKVFQIDQEKQRISPVVVNKAITEIFALPQTQRPRYILMLAGTTLFLFDEEKWPRQSYLQFSLDELYSQGAQPRFRAYFGLVYLLLGRPSLVGRAEDDPMQRLREVSYSKAFEVTDDLREGVIEAVETMANEARYYFTEVLGRPFGQRGAQPTSASEPADNSQSAPSQAVVNSVTSASQTPPPQEDGKQGAQRADDTFAQEVKDDCLILVYRLLFLFYAESRPELEILPMGLVSTRHRSSSDYHKRGELYRLGYSLEMLRDLEQRRLTTDRSRNGYFFQDSLGILFQLLQRGYRISKEEQERREAAGLEVTDNSTFWVQRLDSPLFLDGSLKRLRGVRLRNVAWQRIIRSLSLTRQRNGRSRGRISYANLGVNQLGSVYESLLAYRGFYAEEDLIEVKPQGAKESEGTYLVPLRRIGDFRSGEVVLEDCEPRILAKGSFVYRLNGRDRQKSASYYTPEVLTSSTIHYTLQEIIADVRAGRKKPESLLELKILEPAMGAAAFQNEIINQLAAAYLATKQEQLRKLERRDWRIPADSYRDELQRVKSYIATHNVYGVDLNAQAIELGKLALWLNVIHRGMVPPFFAGRLAVGNAVLGVHLRCYSRGQIYRARDSIFSTDSDKSLKLEWWNEAPHRIKLGIKGSLRQKTDVYHFLLPVDKMLAVSADKELKGADEASTKLMRNRLKDWKKPLQREELERLEGISNKFDKCLESYISEQRAFRRELEMIESSRDYWPNKRTTTIQERDGSQMIASDGEDIFGHVERTLSYLHKQALMQRYTARGSAYHRLRLVMDYWCALWFWPLEDADAVPTRREYWDELEALLDYQGGATSVSQAVDAEVAADVRTSGLFAGEEGGSGRLQIVEQLRERYHFFHPMLEFIEVFTERDGFDIICGNPPWVKLEYDEKGVVSEYFPEVMIRKTSAPEVARLVSGYLKQESELAPLLASERLEATATKLFMGAPANNPLIAGQQAELSRVILAGCLDLASPTAGYIGLVTPTAIYVDANAKDFRREIYQRLRYLFEYKNRGGLFSGVDSQLSFLSQIVGPKHKEGANFYAISTLYHPNTIPLSFQHDGHGICEGAKTKDGKNNLAGHRDRIIHYTPERLALLSRTFEDGATTDCPNFAWIFAEPLLAGLEKLAQYPLRVRDFRYLTTECLHETGGVKKGITKRQEAVSDLDNYGMIYSAPMLQVANPYFQQAQQEVSSNSAYDVLDLTTLPEGFVQRSVYQRALPVEEYQERMPDFPRAKKGEAPYPTSWIDSYKVAFRRMLNLQSERTLICAVLPSKTAHIHVIRSISFFHRADDVDMAALASSLVVDYLVKTMGAKDLMPSRLENLPMGIAAPYREALRVRVLRLNCLTRYYAELWQDVWSPAFAEERWTRDDERLSPFAGLAQAWTTETPLRNDYERRQALVEIDVLAAMALGLSLQELETIYTLQFAVLQTNEAGTYYDRTGRIISTPRRNQSIEREDWERVRTQQAGQTYVHTVSDKRNETYAGQQITFFAPYDRCDRLEDYRQAWRYFAERFWGDAQAETPSPASLLAGDATLPTPKCPADAPHSEQ